MNPDLDLANLIKTRNITWEFSLSVNDDAQFVVVITFNSPDLNPSRNEFVIPRDRTLQLAQRILILREKERFPL